MDVIFKILNFIFNFRNIGFITIKDYGAEKDLEEELNFVTYHYYAVDTAIVPKHIREFGNLHLEFMFEFHYDKMVKFELQYKGEKIDMMKNLDKFKTLLKNKNIGINF